MKDISARTGMLPSKLTKIFSGSQSLAVDELETICAAIELPLAELVSTAAATEIKELQPISAETEELICKQTELFDIIEILSIPYTLKALTKALNCTEEKTKVRLDQLKKMGLVTETLSGEYVCKNEIYYETQHFFEVVAKKLTIICRKVKSAYQVKEYWRLNTSMHLNVYLTEAQTKIIRENFIFISKQALNYHKLNIVSGKKTSDITLKSLHTFLSNYEVEHG
jgi:uncharacterized protein YbaR (Trm112 family)